jgi:hypothetical protein
MYYVAKLDLPHIYWLDLNRSYADPYNLSLYNKSRGLHSYNLSAFN